MILWYAGLALVIVWNVFKDPAVDHRLVVAGALVPDAVDVVVAGHPAYAHALVAPVAVLTAVMVATRGRRVVRRRLLALPIGMFLHLVLDGTWTRSKVLWWPFLGAFPDGRLWPPLGVALAEEVAGALALWWFVRRFRLTDPGPRSTFLRTGRLVAPGAGVSP